MGVAKTEIFELELGGAGDDIKISSKLLITSRGVLGIAIWGREFLDWGECSFQNEGGGGSVNNNYNILWRSNELSQEKGAMK